MINKINKPILMDSKILRDKNISLAAKGLFAEITLRSNSDGIISYEILDKMPHVEDKQTVDALLDELWEAGYLTEID